MIKNRDVNLDPYIIGDSVIYTLGGQHIQFGPISVKDLSIHDIDVPEIIVFRPDDYLTIEFNFFHLFFVHSKKLTVYASKDQIVSLKKMMQIALFAGVKDWAKDRLIALEPEVSPADWVMFKAILDDYFEDKKTINDLIDTTRELLSHQSEVFISTFKLFLNQELSIKAFPIYQNEINIITIDDFTSDSLCFVEYREGEDIPINGYSLSLVRNQVSISKDNELLHKDDRDVRPATDLILTKFPAQLIIDLTIKHRHKLVANGIAQIGSGDGMAYTPNQDTSCTLIRQADKTYLLDASIQSIIKSSYLGVNVYEDDIVALLTHGCHGDHGAGLYYIARIRNMFGRTLKILCHPVVLENYVAKCAYIYQNEYNTKDIEQIKTRISALFTPVSLDTVMITPFNTHSVPTTGFYFKLINFYITGDMSGAELLEDTIITENGIDVSPYYLKEDLEVFKLIKKKVITDGFVAMECGHPPIHIPRDLIYTVLGGECVFNEKIQAKKLFLYHTSGQEDAHDWVPC